MREEIYESHHPKLEESTLLQPFRHALAGLILPDEFTSICLFDSFVDFVNQVEPL